MTIWGAIFLANHLPIAAMFAQNVSACEVSHSAEILSAEALRLKLQSGVLREDLNSRGFLSPGP